jgi:hypothetical protein
MAEFYSPHSTLHAFAETRAYFYSLYSMLLAPMDGKNMISIVGFVSCNHVIKNSCAHKKYNSKQFN